MKIFTWNKLWSRPAKEADTILKSASSIHPHGRTERYREKNRAIRLRRRGERA